MLGAFDTEIKIGLVFYIYHGFLKQQFRSLLHCFHLFIVEHYEKATLGYKYLKNVII